MTKEFNNADEIQKYYNEEHNTYIFRENNKLIDLVVFNFDLNIEANINAWNISARDIKAKCINVYDITANDIEADKIIAHNINAHNINSKDIDAHDVNAGNINAENIITMDIVAHDIYAKVISYYAICYAYNDIKCNRIVGRRDNAKHFALDGKLEVLEDDKGI